MEFPTIPGVLCGLRFFDDIREVKPITAKDAKNRFVELRYSRP
jgi:hypothetical protein